jgi:hypothetical protein
MVNEKRTDDDITMTEVVVPERYRADFKKFIDSLANQPRQTVIQEVRIRTRPFIGNGHLAVLLAANKNRVDGYIPQSQQGRKSAVRVQVLPMAVLKSFLEPSKRKEQELKFGAVSQSCFSRISYLEAFATAIHTRDPRVLVRAIVGRAERHGEDPVGAFRSKVIDLGIELNNILGRVSFVVWWNEAEGQYLPGLFCASIEAALGALTYLEIARNGGVSFCRRPNCKKPFFPARKKQRYCSPQCQAADASARYRDRRGAKRPD